MGSPYRSIHHPQTSLSPINSSSTMMRPNLHSTLFINTLLFLILLTLTLTTAKINSPRKHTKHISEFDRNLLAASEADDKDAFYKLFRQDFQQLRRTIRSGEVLDKKKMEEYFNPQDVGLASPWKEAREGHLSLMRLVIQGKWGLKDIPGDDE